MSVAPSYTADKATPQAPPRETTLLELVRAIGEVTNDEHEVVATVLRVPNTAQVGRLTVACELEPGF